MKKLLLTLSIITSALLILTSCTSNSPTNTPTENETVATTENTASETESTVQENPTDGIESATNEATDETPTQEIVPSTQETTTAKTTEPVIPATQETVTEATTKAPEKVTKPTGNTATTTTPANTSNNLISKEKAKEIVLKHAGLSESDIIRFRIELDREITGTKYDIDFRAGDFEYEYELNATNGHILKSEKEAEKNVKPTQPPETTTAPASTSDNLISKDKAKEIVLKHAGVSEADISRYRIETDREINRVTYEISFYSGNFEYDYEINAANGNILKSEKEAEKNVKPTQQPETTTIPASTSDNLISKDKAKEIVLKHAGISEADISRYRIETDREITGNKYDIDFRSGNFEYEYEIDATNGNILKSEKERID